MKVLRDMINQANLRELSAILAGQRSPRSEIDEVVLREGLEALIDEFGEAAADDWVSKAGVRRRKIPDLDAKQNEKLIKEAQTIKYFAEGLARNLEGSDPEIHGLAIARLAALDFTRLSGREHERPVSGHQWLKDVRVLAECCTRLETFVASQQRHIQGPRDEWLNSLMLKLAEVYCAARGEHLDPLEMPRGQTTIFIRFCDAVMAEFFADEHVNSGQLAIQWRRLLRQLYPDVK